MSSPLATLSDAQRGIATHTGGPLLVEGPAGSGKTRSLTARLEWLAREGIPPERVLVLAGTPAAVEEIRTHLEDQLEQGFEELAVFTPWGFCERLLREHPLPARLDPFFVTASRADRVALLLDRLDELSLVRHDFRGRPAALIARFVERIDALKGELVDPRAFAERLEAASEDDEALELEREFAQLYRDHDRLLEERGTPDVGELLIRACRLLEDHPPVRAQTAERYPHVLVDDFQDADPARVRLVELLGREHRRVVLAADPPQAIEGPGTALARFRSAYPDLREVSLTHPFRGPPGVLRAALRIVDPAGAEPDAEPPRGTSADPAGFRDTEGALPGTATPESSPADRVDSSETDPQINISLTRRPQPRFWCCANERAQAQGTAADIERLISRDGVPAARIAVLVRSTASEAQAVAGALEERSIPYRVLGSAAFFERAEVRDVLAWMRLLADPRDAPAVVRALARPPIELRQVDLARVIQIARRRKLDVVTALAAALEAPQVPPEARERIQTFLRLHRSAVAALDTARPDLFVHRLIEHLGLRRQQLFAAHTDVVERLVNLARLGELAADFARRQPQSSARELAAYLAATSDAGPAGSGIDGGAGGRIGGGAGGIDGGYGGESLAAGVRARAVQVMDIEASRGREFDHVYLLGLHARRFPGAPAEGSERLPHLLYLAITRARDRLVLAYPAASAEGVVQPPSPLVEDVRRSLRGEWEDRGEELFGPAETLHATLRLMRDEVLESVSRVGGRLGELRLDTDLDVSHGVVRYLELVKLAALLERPPGQSVVDALPDINARLLATVTPTQREIFLTSPLDETLLAAEHDDRARAQAIAARDEPSLEPFLPRKGDGLLLSASDIETYRSCPLRYKFARVFRIPSEPTLNQRFGIAVHQVLERYHSAEGGTLAGLIELLEGSWRRGGFGDSDQERQLREKARAALVRYHERLRREPAEPVWFERSFSFRLGPHHMRGRVDRVDRVGEDRYELIDYKTGRPRTAAQLKEDVQLSLYAIGAREAWQLDAVQQSYYYVLDDQKVPVPRGPRDEEWIRETVIEVGEGILGQEFEPTPSFATCSMCDYRIVCPAAEK